MPSISTSTSAAASTQASPPISGPALALSPAEAPTKVASPLDRLHRLTIERYYQMIEAGFFGENEPIYLWKGQLVEKMTKNQPHTISLTCLYRQMSLIVPDTFYVSQEQPIAIADDSVPEPDLTVVRGKPRDYPRRPPTTNDVILVVEVADSSLAIDSGDVLNTYAEHGIPVYWIVNIPARQIEVHSEPTGPGDSAIYRVKRTYYPGMKDSHRQAAALTAISRTGRLTCANLSCRGNTPRKKRSPSSSKARKSAESSSERFCLEVGSKLSLTNSAIRNPQLK